jgi:hypothetical protein
MPEIPRYRPSPNWYRQEADACEIRKRAVLVRIEKEIQ